MQLVVSMSEGAVVLKLASSEEFPVSAHLCLKLHFVLLNEVLTITLVLELLLRAFNSGLLILKVYFLWLAALFFTTLVSRLSFVTCRCGSIRHAVKTIFGLCLEIDVVINNFSLHLQRRVQEA